MPENHTFFLFSQITFLPYWKWTLFQCVTFVSAFGFLFQLQQNFEINVCSMENFRCRGKLCVRCSRELWNVFPALCMCIYQHGALNLSSPGRAILARISPGAQISNTGVNLMNVNSTSTNYPSCSLAAHTITIHQPLEMAHDTLPRHQVLKSLRTGLAGSLARVGP